MPVRAQGSTADFQLDVKNGSGDFVDPSSLTLTFKDSLGATVSGFPEVYPGDIIKDSIGNYHYDWTIPIALPIGTYTAQWDAVLLGAPEQAFETWEIVLAGSLTTGPFDFLQDPEDYDAIRGLLGVTELDVEDTDIQRFAFGPEAELIVKRRVSNWATQMLDIEMLNTLRLATIYQTACLMAQSWVRGGTIGLARPLSTGEGRDWAQAAEHFCSRSEYWMNIADSGDVDGEDTSVYLVNPMRVSGPTAVRKARRRAGLPTDGVPADIWWAGYPPFWPE